MNAQPAVGLTGLPEWRALADHFGDVHQVTLREIFRTDPGRGERLTAEGAGVFLDYSKNRLTDDTLRLLVALARARGLRGRIDAMFAGEHINATEDRAVLHVALRAPSGERIVTDGRDVVPGVHAVLDLVRKLDQALKASQE